MPPCYARKNISLLDGKSALSDPMANPFVCPHCGQVHPSGTRFCPVTGQQIPYNMPRPPAQRNWLWALLGLVGVGIIVFGGYWLLKGPSFEFFPNSNLPAPRTPTQTIPIDPGTPIPSSEPTATRPPAPSDTPPPSPTDFPTGTLIPSPTPSPTETPLPTLTETNTGALQGKIAFTCQIFRDPDRNQICVVNADGTGWFRLTTRDTVDHNYPAFAPDGNRVVYSSNLAGSYDLFERDLNGNEQQITDLSGNEYAPAISPDGQWIAFTYNNGAHQTIWITDLVGNNLHPITSGSDLEAWDPTWSPDGSQILFASGSIGNIQLFIMDADGANIGEVTNFPNLRGRSSWSPDGLTLATYQGITWQREIVLFDLNGENLQQLTDGGNNLAPNFSPYGGWLAFTSYKDNFGDDHGCEIYVMRLDGSETLRLTDNDYCDWQPSWGP